MKLDRKKEKYMYNLNKTINLDSLIICKDWEKEYKAIWKNSNDIVDINVIVPNKVVEITFADGDKQKSVCQEGDTFSLEQAVTICLGKHIVGSSAYGRIVNKAITNYTKKVEAEKKAEADRKEAERISAKKKAHTEAYIKRCKQKEAERLKKEREEKIAIQREAYIQAMKYMENSRRISKREDHI